MRRTPMLALAALALVTAACGSGEPDQTQGVEAGATPEATPFFAPSDADALAHGSLPRAEDLAGPGWELIATDGGDPGDGDTDEDDSDFDAALTSDPACARFADLATSGSLFGEVGDDRQPAGSASVELENALFEGFFPLNLEMDVSIMPTAAEVDRDWAVVQELMADGGMQTCLARVFETAFSDFDQEGDVPGGFEAKASEARPSAAPPHQGVALAFDLDLAFFGFDADMVIEMYFWPYGNAEVSVLVFGSPEALASGVSGDALAVLDARLAAAAASA